MAAVPGEGALGREWADGGRGVLVNTRKDGPWAGEAPARP